MIVLAGVKHFTFKIQSASKDPDYLEQRINAFLEDRQDWQPQKEQISALAKSIVNDILQKPQ